MPVIVEHLGKQGFYKFAGISEGGNILLNNEKGDEIKVESPLKLDSSFHEKEFDLYFLAKKDVKESDIFQVYCRKADKRIGWLIPTIALSSRLHDYAENPHFLRYAYIGIRESLIKLDDTVYSEIINGNQSTISYSDIFHDSTTLLIISKETLIDGVHFDIDRASPSLIKYGYIKLGQLAPDEIQIRFDTPSSPRLYIEQISDHICSEQLISEILNVSFAYETKAVFRFFFIYQLFEMLIDDIFKNEQTSIVDGLIRAKGDSGRTKEVLEKMQNIVPEKKRISLLIEKYSKPNDSLSHLRSLCNELLKMIGKEEVDGFQNYFYKIRNFIFHQYRDFPSSAIETLNEIIKETIELLPSILSSYRYPESYGDRE